VPTSSRRKPPSSVRRRAPAPRIVCILSRKKSLYSTGRLVQAGKEAHHRAVVADTLRCHLLIETGQPSVYYSSVALPPPDVVIPRIGASITSYGLSVVTQFELMGVPGRNSALAINRSRDKLRCLQLLAQAGLGVPKTFLAHRGAHTRLLAERVGGLPAIVKLPQGTQGIGVMIATTPAELETLLHTFWDLGHDVLVQEFIQEAGGCDVRAVVVGDRVVAAMRRQAKGGGFRSNIHRGGEAIPVELPHDFEETAIRAARIVGLEVAGVDLLESRRGPLVVEVNSSPGFEGIEKATGTDVAGAIIRRALELTEATGRRPQTGLPGLERRG